MPKEPELKARDKVVVRMTREGAVEENLTAGTEQRVSKRLEDAELVKPAETAVPSEALSQEEQKKVQMRRQQRQFQAEHAEDNDTQPPSETSVTEEKRTENPPQNVPEPLPSPETPFKPPTLEQHGVSSHTGTVIAETVVTHKLRKTSAVEAVDADAVLSQAAETSSAKPIIDDAVSTTKRIVIDYDAPINEDEEQYQTYFLNMVDESDLLALLDDDTAAALTTCNCKEKCVAGQVNTDCPVCKTNMSECTGTAPATPEPDKDAETDAPAPKPEKKSNIGMILVIFALAGAAGAAYYYIKFVKGRKPKDEDMDFFDDEGYEEEPYINEDEEPQIAEDAETDGDED